MDDQSSRTGEETVGAGAPMLFKLMGVVYDQNGDPVGNYHPIKASLIWWQFDQGVSTKHTEQRNFSTGVSGSYSYFFLGPNNPIPAWDSAKAVGVTVENAMGGWTTTEPGQYLTVPTGTSPINLLISDTTIKQG